MKLLHLLLLLFLTASALQAQTLQKENSVEDVLDNLHRFAAEADGKAYFDLFAKDAVFMGTDASERWDVEAFMKYAMNRFDSGEGWKYKSLKRSVYYADERNIAWFDEVLVNEKYGEFRGTGVLKRENEHWKIVQYNLLLPIPNEIFMEIAQHVQEFNKQNEENP